MSLATCHCSTPRLVRAANHREAFAPGERLFISIIHHRSRVRRNISDFSKKPRAVGRTGSPANCSCTSSAVCQNDAFPEAVPRRETSARMTTSPAGKQPTRRKEGAPRIWEGCDFFAWMRLLGRNRLAVHPAYSYIAVVVTVVSAGHTLLRCLQGWRYGDRVRRVPIREAPLFIV